MRKLSVMILVVLLLFCGGCRKKEKIEITLPQKLWMTYDTDVVMAYAVDSQENVYTLEYERGREDTGFSDDTKCWFRRYDPEGVCRFSKESAGWLAGRVHAMAYCEEKVYFAAKKNEKLMLYACGVDTGEIKEVTGVPGFSHLLRIAAVGDKLYLLGNREEYSFSTTETGKILEYSVTDGRFAALELEGILDIAGTREGNLLLYQESGEEAKEYSFLLYNVQRGAVKMLAKMTDKIAVKIAEGPLEGSVVFTRTTKEASVGYAKFSNLKNVAEVYPMINVENSCLVCVNGKLILPNSFADDSMVVVDLTGATPEEKEIRYFSIGNGIEPYGCGFTITRNEVEEDKLVLKLLAQDTDFDMTFVDSWFSPMTGVRDSGCFYPLNDVPGVKEYLDRCFPYVKDAVTDENGDVWMLPVKVDIPLIVCDSRRCREQGYAFGENMTYEEFFAAMDVLSEEEREQTGGLIAFARGFMTAYFYDKKSVDTSEFRQTMNMLKQIEPLLNGEGNFFSQDYIFKTARNISTYEPNYLYNFGSDGRAYCYPKYDKNAKNVATCQGFVINPKSDNLEQTLRYVATWVAYQMNNSKEIPSFFAVPENRTDSFLGSLYKVYENGAITMGISEDLYWGYLDVVAGTRDLEDYIQETEKKLKIYFGE